LNSIVVKIILNLIIFPKNTCNQEKTPEVFTALITDGTIRNTTLDYSDLDSKIHSWVAAWPKVLLSKKLVSNQNSPTLLSERELESC